MDHICLLWHGPTLRAQPHLQSTQASLFIQTQAKKSDVVQHPVALLIRRHTHKKRFFNKAASFDTLLVYHLHPRKCWLPGRSHGDVPINDRHVQTERPELTV